MQLYTVASIRVIYGYIDISLSLWCREARWNGGIATWDCFALTGMQWYAWVLWISDAQYLLLCMSAWWGAALSADSPNKPLCAVLFMLKCHVLLPCPPAALRRAELCGLCCVGSTATRTLVQSLFKHQELQPPILPLGTWVSSSHSWDVSLMLSLNLLGFVLNLSHYISSLTDAGFCLANYNLLSVYEEYKQLCIFKVNTTLK